MDPPSHPMELPVLDSFSQIRGNYNAVKELRSVFENPSKSLLNVVVLVLGPSGCGKSALENIVRVSGECEVLLVTERMGNIEGTIRNFVEHRDLTTMLFQRSGEARKVIMLDDVDAILAIDKNVFAIVQKYKSRVAFLCTALLSEERKLSNVKKIATHVVRMSRLSAVDCFLRVQELVPDLPMDDDELLSLVKRHESNLSILKQYIDTYIDNGRSVSCKSEVSPVFNVNIYDQAESLMNKGVEPATVWAIVRKDASLVSMLLHENIVNVTASRNRKADMGAFLSMYDAMCDTDEYERASFVRNNQAWSDAAFDLIDFRKMSVFNKHMPTLPKTKAKTKFTQYFTKLSLQTTTRKRLEDACDESDGVGWLTLVYACNKACVDAEEGTVIESQTASDLIKRFQKDFGP